MAYPSKISLRVNNGQYACAEGGGGQNMVANRGAIGPWESFHLIDHGNGTISLQVNSGQYMCAEGGGGQTVVANRAAVGPWETFRLIDHGDGTISLQASNGQYVCAEGGGGQVLVANRAAIGPWETFTLIDLAGQIPGRSGQYDWSTQRMLPQPGTGAVSFIAIASNDVHIAISPTQSTANPMYEIVIGGWTNTQSAIRRSSQGAAVVTEKVALATPNGDNQLWVAIDSASKMIFVGRGAIGQNVIMSFHDPDFIANARYVSFSSWDTPIIYRAATCSPSGGALALTDTPGTAISLGNPPKLNIQGKITVSAWIYPLASDGLRDIVSRGYVLNPAGEIYLRICNGTYQFGSWNNADHVVIAPIPSGDLGSWVHLTGVYDGAAWKLYRNGQLLAGAGNPVGALPVAAGWSIGSRGDQIERCFHGYIRGVSIWNTAVDAQGLASAMACSLNGNEPGLVGYWPLTETSGTTVADKTASPANGTVQHAGWTLTYAPPLPAPPPPPIPVNEQDSWTWCNKCQGLYYAKWTSLTCPAGGVHGNSGSSTYQLFYGARPDGQGQHQWRWCRKCSGLYFSGLNAGVCSAGGSHDSTGSADYVLTTQEMAGVTAQPAWMWCNRCQGLFYSGYPDNFCPAGGAHDHTGSGNYQLRYIPPVVAPPPPSTSGTESGGAPPTSGEANVDNEMAQLVKSGLPFAIFGVPFTMPIHFTGSVQTTLTADTADFVGTAHVDSPFSADVGRLEAKISRGGTSTQAYLRFDLPISLANIIAQQVQPHVPAAAWTVIDALLMPYLHLYDAPTIILAPFNQNDDQLGAIVQGINFYKVFKLSDFEPFKTLNNSLSVLHLEQRSVVLHVGAGTSTDPTNWQADMILNLNQSLGTDTVVLKSLSLTIKPGVGSLSAGAKILFAVHVSSTETLNLSGGINLKQTEAGTSMTIWGGLDAANGAWQDPLGLKGVSIQGLGVEIGAATVFPFIALGFRGDVYVGSSLLHATLAFSFNPADIASTVLQIASPEGINLLALLTAVLHPSFLPKDIFDVALTDLNIYIAPNGGSIAGKAYKKGIELGGKLNLWGYHAAVDGMIEYGTGGYLHGDLDRISISGAGLQFIQLTDAAGTGNPTLQIDCTSQKQGAHISGKLSILGGFYSETVDVDVGKSGFHLTLQPSANGIYAGAQVGFDGSTFSISVTPGFRFGFSLFGQDISVGVKATVSIRVSSSGFYQSLGFSFSAFGSDHSVGSVSYTLPVYSTDDLNKIFSQFGDIVKKFFTDTLAGGLATAVTWVKDNVVNDATKVSHLFVSAGADSIAVAKGLVSSFGLSAQDAAKIVGNGMQDAARILKDGFGMGVADVGNFLKSAYGASADAVNAALGGIGYAADAIHDFMHDAFSWFPHVDFPFVDSY